MQPVLSDTLIQLSQDHIVFRRMLNILDRQIEAVARSRAPDFDVLGGIVAYFRDYPRQFHHAVEHLIYASLKDRIPEVADGLEFIEQQHGEIAHEIEKFSAAVQSVRADVEVSRRAFRDAARRFIAFERKHIRGEEASLFYLAMSKLSPTDWFTIDREARLIRAPLSQNEQGGYFRKLYADVTIWDFESNLDTAANPN